MRHSSAFLIPLTLVLGAFSSSVVNAQVVSGNTTLTIRNGDRYETVQSVDTSTVNMIGGFVSQLVPSGNSTVNISDGQINIIIPNASPAINISGGTIGAFFTSGGDTVSITGGTFDTVSLENVKSAIVSGGSFQLFASGDGNAGITGGSFGSLQTLVQGTINLTGYDFALTSMSQGNITNQRFIYDGTFFTVTGRLQNNTSAGSYVLFDAASRINRSSGVTTSDLLGNFALNDLSLGTTTVLAAAAAPEPASLALLLPIIGGVGMVPRIMRRLRK